MPVERKKIIQEKKELRRMRKELAEKIVRFLKKHPQQAFSSEEITEAIKFPKFLGKSLDELPETAKIILTIDALDKLLNSLEKEKKIERFTYRGKNYYGVIKEP